MKKIALAVLGVLAAGCSGNVKKIPAELFSQDPYLFMARKLSASADGSSAHKIAVLPFSYTDNRESGAGVAVSERLLTRMIQEGKYEVVERNLLEKVMGELKLQYSGVVDATSIKSLGKVLGVDAVVTGTLMRREDGRLEINARLIKAETAVILTAAAAAVSEDWETFSAGLQAVPEPAARPAAPPAVPQAVRMLTPAERARCPRGMVAYWNFDGGSDKEAYDIFGGNNGRLFGPVRTADGKAGFGLDFKGQDHMRVDSGPALRMEKEISIEAWIKYRTVNYSESGSRLFMGSRAYAFTIGGAENWHSNLAASVAGFPAELRGASLLSPGVWYHAAFTYNGSRVTLYLNGEADGYLPGTAALKYNPGYRWSFIGWDPTAVVGYRAPLDGVIDEVAVYDRALSPSEIALHYKKGLAGKGYCTP